MHAEKYDTLRRVPGLQPAAQAAAMAGRCSVDDLVHAAHGRPAPQEARAALASLTQDQRAALASLPWAYTCPGCQTQVSSLLTCTGCKRLACDTCQAPGFCTDCRASRAREAKLKAAQDAAAERARALSDALKQA